VAHIHLVRFFASETGDSCHYSYSPPAADHGIAVKDINYTEKMSKSRLLPAIWLFLTIFCSGHTLFHGDFQQYGHQQRIDQPGQRIADKQDFHAGELPENRKYPDHPQDTYTENRNQ
jgi:hypothetical protein